MEKPIKHVVSLSGGKDSTAMLLRLIEEGRPVDIILFCDTGLEFEAMYRHIDKLEKHIGKPITRLKSDKTFEYLLLEHMPKRKSLSVVKVTVGVVPVIVGVRQFLNSALSTNIYTTSQRNIRSSSTLVLLPTNPNVSRALITPW